MDPRSLLGGQVELSAPDGSVFRFRVQSLVPYAGETYAVLEHEEEDGQLLVTHLEAEGGAPAFVVVGEDDIITGVMEKLVARSIAKALEESGEKDSRDEEWEDEEPPSPSCNCGRSHRRLPDYIKRQD